MSENQLGKILSLLETIDERIVGLERICSHTNAAMNAAIPRTRKSLAPTELNLTPEELKEKRIAKARETFNHVVSMERAKREKFVPDYLLEERGKPPFGAIPFANLVNRIYGIACFKAVGKFNETSAMENAEKAIRESGLTVCTVSELCIRKGEGYVESGRLVVLTDKAAHKYLGVDAGAVEEEEEKVEVDDDGIWKPAPPPAEDDDRIWKPAPKVEAKAMVEEDDDRIWKPTPKRCPSHLEVLDSKGNCPLCIFEKENDEKEGLL